MYLCYILYITNTSSDPHMCTTALRKTEVMTL